MSAKLTKPPGTDTRNEQKDALQEYYKNKTILVTGGVGSIGSEIVKQLLQFNPQQVRVLDNRETEMFTFQQLMKAHKNVRFLLGDVRDKERLMRASSGINIIFHAAAYKHVEACEYNPDEAVKTNIIGTENLIDAAIAEQVDKVIFISTDKAVNPVNTMGATKLLGEKLIMNACYRRKTETVFSCVRFGNVLNSQGSVMPIFINQIKHGGPVSLTHAEMRRFFISIPQAVNLVLKSAVITTGREIFILKMDAFRIQDLAEVMIRECSPKFGINPDTVKIEITGIRPGERMDELLMTEEESNLAEEVDGMFVIRPDVFFPHYAQHTKSGHHRIDPKNYNSYQAPLLTKEEIKKRLQDNRLI
ncbi:MAG: SDR family NAD(P)-dependent oxidoreductase [Nanoarchaeota archaeon]